MTELEKCVSEAERRQEASSRKRDEAEVTFTFIMSPQNIKKLKLNSANRTRIFFPLFGDLRDNLRHNKCC